MTIETETFLESLGNESFEALGFSTEDELEKELSPLMQENQVLTSF